MRKDHSHSAAGNLLVPPISENILTITKPLTYTIHKLLKSA